VNRLIKVSDAGYREQQAAGIREESAKGAELRLKLDEATRELLRRHGALSRVPAERRTPEQSRQLDVLRPWHRYYSARMDEWAGQPGSLDKWAREEMRGYSEEVLGGLDGGF
jgi:hypothetical protein